MHVGAVLDLRGPAAGVRATSSTTSAAGCTSSRATGRSSPSRRWRPAGRCGSTTPTSTSSTTCATPRCRSRAPRSSSLLLAARIFSQRLDRSKPLWETWLVEGLEDNRFALISKTHHALVDGIAGRGPATVLFDVDARAAGGRAPHEREPWEPAPEPSTADLAGRAALRGLVRTAVERRRTGRVGAAAHPERAARATRARRSRASARSCGRG